MQCDERGYSSSGEEKDENFVKQFWRDDSGGCCLETHFRELCAENACSKGHGNASDELDGRSGAGGIHHGSDPAGEGCQRAAESHANGCECVWEGRLKVRGAKGDSNEKRSQNIDGNLRAFREKMARFNRAEQRYARGHARDRKGRYPDQVPPHTLEKNVFFFTQLASKGHF